MTVKKFVYLIQNRRRNIEFISNVYYTLTAEDDVVTVLGAKNKNYITTFPISLERGHTNYLVFKTI
jgi:hypothetical protein